MPGGIHPLVIVYAAVLGAVVGSFLNVVIYRVPRRLSIVTPRSYCPRCERAIPWYENLPIVSWLALGGRCHGCREPISWRYPLVEAASAALAALGVAQYGLTALGIEVVLFGWISLALGLIDLEHQILPDVITYPSIALGLGFSLLGGWTTPLSSVVGALVGAGLPIAVILLYRWMRGAEGMGWGDVKYLAAIGAVVGARDCVRILIVASVVGAALGIGLIVAGRGSSKTALPFGTFLALAVLLWLFAPPAWRAALPF